MIHLISQSNSHQLFDLINQTDFTKKIFCHKTRFANNEITVTLDESVRNKVVAIIAQPVDYEDMFELMATIDAARRSSAKEVIAVIPHLPHSRQERRNNGERTSISSRLYADFLQIAGLDRLITVDLHTTAIEGFYKIPVDNITPYNILKNHIISRFDDNLILVSPDMGGMKRVEFLANELDLPTAFLSKQRKEVNKVSNMNIIGNVENKNVVIIDDMIDTGGTILKAANVLKENGANKISVLATHGIFSNNGCEKLVSDKNITDIVVTNTLIQKENVRVLDVSSEIIKVLKKLNTE